MTGAAVLLSAAVAMGEVLVDSARIAVTGDAGSVPRSVVVPKAAGISAEELVSRADVDVLGPAVVGVSVPVVSAGEVTVTATVAVSATEEVTALVVAVG